MRKIGILTSGGDAPGMNASIRAIVRTAIKNDIKVMGIREGYSGLYNGDIYPMDRRSVSDIIQKGGTILKTARFDSFSKKEVRRKASQVLKVYGIEGLVVIGGDGTFRGAQGLGELGINTIGIPGTIDNDLAYTDYSIGFDTAQNTIIDAINKIRDTSASHQRVSVVEVMGRDCGDIALHAGVGGGAEFVILPEKGYNEEEICKNILQDKVKGKLHSLIIMAEGVGGTDELASKIEEVTGIETRATKLGHIQRGGSPSGFDRVLASRMGYKAVELLCQGKTSKVLGMKDGKIFDMDINEALEVPRNFDDELYTISKIISN